jgi:putrescine transport system substrate-binding protein
MVLVALQGSKHKPMIDRPTPVPPPPTPAPPPGLTDVAAKRARAWRTVLLGAGLSVVFLGLVAIYLSFASVPNVSAPTTSARPAFVARATDTVVVIAPRFLVAPSLMADFEAETGLNVELIPYDNEETILTIGNTAPLNADVIVVAGSTIAQFAQSDLLAVLPARQISNLGRIDPTLRTLSRRYDQLGLSAVPLAWTNFGLGLNPAALNERLGVNASLDTWSILFDATQVQRAADCGIQGVDAPSLAFPAALLSLGLPPFSETPADIERASAAWETLQPYLMRFDTRGLGDNLAAGSVCLGLTSSAQVFKAQATARDAGRQLGLAFVSPREGAILRLYMLAQPRGAQNADKGAMLIDYLLRPDVSARLTNASWAANAVPASQLYVRQDIKDNAVIYPPLDAFNALLVEANPSAATVGLRNRFWLLLNAGPSPG